MTVKPIAAIVGDTRIEAESAQARLLLALGEFLVTRGFRLQTGGLGDLPRLVAEGARASGSYQVGDLVSLLPGFDPLLGHGDIIIPTGLDLGRNALVANADVVIAVGGGAGTLSEIALAWQLGRPILAWRGGGWSARVAGTAIDHRRSDAVLGFRNLDELREELEKVRGKSYPRHPGIRAATNQAP